MVNGIRRILNYKSRVIFNSPLWVGVCGGFVGVLIDLDHPISYWLTGKVQRWFHIPFAIISGVVLCIAGACIGRQVLKLVLKNKKWVKYTKLIGIILLVVIALLGLEVVWILYMRGI